jgi:very-short-patch-repair endonuclease
MVTGADRQRHHPDANARAKRLRREPTRAEVALWKLLREQPQHHFRRQLALGEYVYDFGDHGSRLLVEVDGGVHDRPDVAARDERKDADAQTLGYRLVRIANDVVLKEPALALRLILEAANAATAPTPPPPHKGEWLQGSTQ